MRLLRDGVVPTVDGTELALRVDTICVHGDNPDAVAFVERLRERLTAAGVELASIA